MIFVYLTLSVFALTRSFTCQNICKSLSKLFFFWSYIFWVLFLFERYFIQIQVSSNYKTFRLNNSINLNLALSFRGLKVLVRLLSLCSLSLHHQGHILNLIPFLLYYTLYLYHILTPLFIPEFIILCILYSRFSQFLDWLLSNILPSTSFVDDIRLYLSV